jgi:transposase-like protein
MNQMIYLVTGVNDSGRRAILGMYPAYNMALERMDFLSRIGVWGAIQTHDIAVTDFGTDTEIIL